MKLALLVRAVVFAFGALLAGLAPGHAQSDFLSDGLVAEAAAYAAELSGRDAAGATVEAALAEVARAERDGEPGAIIASYERLVTVEPESYRGWLQLAATWRRVAPVSDKAVGAAVRAWQVGRGEGERFEALLMVAGLLRDRLALAQADFEAARQRLLVIAETSRAWEITPSADADAPLARDFAAAREEAYRDSTNAAGRIAGIVAELDAIYVAVFTVVRDPDAYDQVSAELRGNVFQVAVLGYDGDQRPRYDVVAETLSDHSRACITFTLPVANDADGVRAALALRDAASGAPVPAGSVEISDDKVCILGLEPERSYLLDIAASIRAQTGARLEQAATGIAFSLPPRDPLVGFRGSAFILPRHGTGDVPLYTVNVDSVPLHLLRITDRNLYRHVALGHIGGRLPTQEYREMREQFSEPIWDGAIEVAAEPNRLVTSQVPILRILDGRKQWLRDNPVPDDRSLLPQTSAPQPVGTAIAGAWSADRVSYQSSAEFDGEAGLYALVTDGLDAPVTKKASDGGEESEDGETFCEAYCADNYVVQWLVRTDIGLALYESPETLHVAARSLASGRPVAGATVELVAANNRVLAEGVTDANGVVAFPRRLAEGTRGNRLAVVIARQADDFSFIDFGADRLDLSRLGVFGRVKPGERNAFLYTDRGIYRPDDTVNLTVMVRDASGLVPAAMAPARVQLVGGDGVLDEVEIARGDWQLGGASLALRIPATARLGTAELRVLDAGDDARVIATTTVQIDRFRPDRARIAFIDEPAWTVSAARDGRLDIAGLVAADYLFGDARVIGQAAAANLRGEVGIRVEAAETPVEGCYADFSFGGTGAPPPATVLGRIDGVTDAAGRLAFASMPRPWLLPAGDRPVRAAIGVTLFDNAGAVAARSRTAMIHQDRDWIGVARRPALRPAAANGAFNLAFDVVGLDGSNAALTERPLTFRLFSERDVFVWEQRNGIWTSASDVARDEITADWPAAQRTVTYRPGGQGAGGCLQPGATITTELPLGRYLLEVTDEASGASAAVRFVTGSTTAAITNPEPNILEVASDRVRYAPGETARLQVYAPFDGEVQVAIADQEILAWVSGTTVDRVATIDLPITEAWAGKGLYALATVYRRQTDGTVLHGPARAIGTTHIEVAGAERNFDLTISAPLQVAPDRPTKVSVCVSGGGACLEDFREPGFVSLVAVDEGLVSLTAHPVANPHGFYFGQVRLPIAVMDNYGRILLTEHGGDRPSRLALSNYTSDRIVAVQAGPVPLRDGVAEFDLPPLDLDGSVRLVAIAWTADGVAADEEMLTVGESIVARLDVPRFFTPGDRPVVPLVLSNREVGPGPYRIDIEPPPGITVGDILDAGGASIRDAASNGFDMPLERGATVLTYVALDIAPTLVATEARLAVSVASLGIRRERTVPIRPPSPAVLESLVMTLAPGQGVSTAGLLADFVPGRFQAAGLSVDTRVSGSGPIALLAPGMAADEPETALLERLVWKGMILAGQSGPDRSGRGELADIVREVQALQARNGSFLPYRPIGDLVPQESEDPYRDLDWTERTPDLESSLVFRTALALDFLNAVSGRYGWTPPGGAVPVSLAVERKAAGFLAGDSEVPMCSPAGIYARLVLVPHGRMDDGDVQAMHRQCLNEATPLAQAMLAALFGEFGRSELSREILVSYEPAALVADAGPTKIAMVLSFLVQAGAPEPLLQAVFDELVTLGVPGSVGVSDQAWLSRSAMALGSGDEPALEVTPSDFLSAAGGAGDVLTSGFVAYDRIAADDVQLKNAGATPLSVALVLEGFPTESGSEAMVTQDVRRRLFNQAGEELDPSAVSAHVGEVLLVVVEGVRDSLLPAGQAEGMADLSPALILADLLPSSFEIVQPDAFAADATSQSRLPPGVTQVGKLRWVEAGDDRLVAVILPHGVLGTGVPGAEDGEAQGAAEEAPPPPVDFRVAYRVRVISAGEFLLPATYVEALAQPSATVHSATGRITVSPPRP
jgi:uncharacterized protein YfaS (alpha-2-macroglobulin family)